MNWDAIGAVGEIVGAAGVVLTLIYLAIQIRQNTHALESTAFDSGVSEGNSLRLAIAENEEVSRIWSGGLRDPESLSDLERVRFRIFMSALMDIFNSNYLKKGRSIFSSESWETTEANISSLINTPGMQWYLDNYSSTVTTSFLKYLLDKQQSKRT